MNVLFPLLAVLVAYLLGAIPFGLLVGRAHGVDVRTLGSGNIGATNVFRTVGKRAGVLTFLLDVAKGALAVGVLPFLLRKAGLSLPGTVSVFCGVGVFLGHMFPVYIGFKGGKGVATGLGVAIGLAPWTALIALGAWIAVFVASRYVSVASCVAALVVMVVPWWTDNTGEPHNLVPALLALLGVLAIVRHRSNLRRLAAGTENRFCFTKRQREAAARRERESSHGND